MRGASTVVLSADLSGVVRDVLLDGPDLGFRAGEALAEHVDRGSREKLRRFLDEVREHGTALDWQLVFDVDGGARVLAVSAIARDETLVCVAGRPLGRVAHLASRELATRGEPDPEVRAALHDLAASESEREPEADVLEDMAALNNELMALQRENARQNARLTRANREKELLLSTVAHDLRNPLATTLGYAHLLLEGAAGELSDRERKLVRAIERSSEHVLVLVESLVDWAALTSGQVRLELEQYDLAEQVRDDLELQRVLADAKSITLELRGEGPLEVCADRAKMQQVIRNLLDNAIKFSHPGGRVIVLMAREPERACVSFRDEGVGIAREDLPCIFQPFRRGATRGTAGEKSTGLGLAIVRRIVQSHGGSIDVESEPGAGSTFTVRLPHHVRQHEGGARSRPKLDDRQGESAASARSASST
jgi:signal transduction histidine kinase